ncbi:MAG: hypothetical protein H6936_12650 [Burkholderiales bacterium]|nr:hypothetical protein [Nitrosomonas sp.]MCP5275671.1 hypothetical protein [Burkholderiales bacterium]
MGNRVSVLVAIVVISTFVGCAALEPAGPKQPVKPGHKPTERPQGPLPPSTKPTYNLMGYPPATQEGYVDGCETAKETEWGYKDEARYESDGQYRTGWDDGYFICSRNR